MAAYRAGIMSRDPPSEKREGLEGATQRSEGQQVDVLMIGYISGRGRKRMWSAYVILYSRKVSGLIRKYTLDNYDR